MSDTWIAIGLGPDAFNILTSEEEGLLGRYIASATADEFGLLPTIFPGHFYKSHHQLDWGVCHTYRLAFFPLAAWGKKHKTRADDAEFWLELTLIDQDSHVHLLGPSSVLTSPTPQGPTLGLIPLPLLKRELMRFRLAEQFIEDQ